MTVLAHGKSRLRVICVQVQIGDWNNGRSGSSFVFTKARKRPWTRGPSVARMATSARVAALSFQREQSRTSESVLDLCWFDSSSFRVSDHTEVRHRFGPRQASDASLEGQRHYRKEALGHFLVVHFLTVVAAATALSAVVGPTGRYPS